MLELTLPEVVMKIDVCLGTWTIIKFKYCWKLKILVFNSYSLQIQLSS